jgi:hypothetical protein
MVGVLVLLGHAAAVRAEPAVNDGGRIAPELAQALYGRVEQLREPDGCRLTRLDTSRFRITIALAAPGGAEQFLDVATQSGLVRVSRTVGDWAIAVPEPLARDCPTTVAAIERILGETVAPTAGWHVGVAEISSRWHYVLLAATFLLLVAGTVHVLYREAAARAAPRGAVVALVLVWAVALGLRLWLSPRTFLHEYYHIAETVPAYLSGEVPPGYGKSGPAIFRLVGRVLGLGEDLRIIFLTNAVISSLAVPAAAMLVLAVVGSWAQALCAALLLAVLPHHLRFSAAEDLFVQGITFGMWSFALFGSYLRTRRLEDALLGALAASLATQSRPEMIFFPAVVVAFFLCVDRHGWRVLLGWPTFAAGAALAILLVPHAFDVVRSMREARSPTPHLPPVEQYFQSLLLFDPRVTPVVYPVMLAVGAAWSAIRRPGWLLWLVAVYVGFTLFAMTIFNNPAYRLRAQNLPTSYLVLLAGGAVPVWMAAWRRHRQLGAVLGVALIVLSAVGVVVRWRGFVGELKDQQLEWSFLERHVSDLPAKGTLITAVETGGQNLDAFPEFLLTGSGRRYALLDVRRATEGAVAWPEPTGDLFFYQGMFCYFAFGDEPVPEPMTNACRAVYKRYATEPLVLEDLHTEGYSPLRYAQGGRGVYRIGFYRLTPRTGRGRLHGKP